MSTISKINPNGTILVDDVTVNGAGDADDALRDNTDSSWLQYFAGTGSSEVIVDLESVPALGTTKRVSQVRVVARADSLNGTVSFHGYVRRTASSADTQSFYTTTNMVSGPRTITGSWIKSIPGLGTEWDETTLNAMRMRLKDDNTGGSLPAVYKAYVDVQIHTKPTVTLLSPTSGAIAVTNPLVKWSVSADGDAVAKFQVKIFTVAVAEGGGFDAETSTAVHDSGVQTFTGSNQYQIPAGLLAADTDYYVFVKAATLFPGPVANDYWYSGWANVKFQTASNPTPVVTAPVGAIANAQPTYTWTYADADGKACDHFRLKVMTGAAFLASGGNIETTAAVYEVDNIPGTTLSHTPTILFLQNNTAYVVGITAYTTSPFTTQGTDTENFNTAWVAPNSPQLFVTPNNFGGFTILDIWGRDNLLTLQQSNFEAGITGWAGTNATLAQSGTWFAEGTKSLRLTANSAATMSASTPTGLSGVPVSPGVAYTARVTSRAAVTARSCTLQLQFYNSSGSALSALSTTATNSAGADTAYVVTGTSPAGAAFAALIFTVTSPANAEQHYIDKTGILLRASTPWVPGAMASTFTVQRSDDGGVTWVDVVNGNPLTAGLLVTQDFPLNDWLMPVRVPLQYRAFATSTQSGLSTNSDFTVVTGEMYEPNFCFLKNPFNNTQYLHLMVETTTIERTVTRDRVLYRPLGRKKPVPMRGTYDDNSFTVKGVVIRTLDKETLEAILDADVTLLFETPQGSFWVDFSGDYQASDYLWNYLHSHDDEQTEFSIPFTEVEAPVI
jgi:hypothetical protein